MHFLLQVGADPSARDSSGRSILHFVALSWNAEVISTLLKSSIDVNVLDDEGRNTIHYLAASHSSKNIGFEALKQAF